MRGFDGINAMAPASDLRRYDNEGRDVNDTPGIWDEDDILAIPGHWLVWTEKQPCSIVCNPQTLALMIGEHGMMNAYKMVRLPQKSVNESGNENTSVGKGQ